MLYRSTITETTDENGVTWLTPTGIMEPLPCERCGAESHPQTCPGDRGSHHHGCVHVIAGGLEAVCNDCVEDVAREWEDARTLAASVRELIDSL